MSAELGCRIIFRCASATWLYVRSILLADKWDIRAEHVAMQGWDDFVLMAADVLDDDLFVVISARRASLSFESDMDALPEFLQRYFSRNNLVVIYPGQSGVEPDLETMSRAMSADFEAAPSPLWLKLRSVFRR